MTRRRKEQLDPQHSKIADALALDMLSHYFDVKLEEAQLIDTELEAFYQLTGTMRSAIVQHCEDISLEEEMRHLLRNNRKCNVKALAGHLVAKGNDPDSEEGAYIKRYNANLVYGMLLGIAIDKKKPEAIAATALVRDEALLLRTETSLKGHAKKLERHDDASTRIQWKQFDEYCAIMPSVIERVSQGRMGTVSHTRTGDDGSPEDIEISTLGVFSIFLDLMDSLPDIQQEKKDQWLNAIGNALDGLNESVTQPGTGTSERQRKSLQLRIDEAFNGPTSIPDRG